MSRRRRRREALAASAGDYTSLAVTVARHRQQVRLGPVAVPVNGYRIRVAGPRGRTAIWVRTARHCAEALRGISTGAFYSQS